MSIDPITLEQCLAELALLKKTFPHHTWEIDNGYNFSGIHVSPREDDEEYYYGTKLSVEIRTKDGNRVYLFEYISVRQYPDGRFFCHANAFPKILEYVNTIQAIPDKIAETVEEWATQAIAGSTS